MNYLKIIRDAFFITLRHKFLWFFGFFLILTSGGFSLGNFNFNVSLPFRSRQVRGIERKEIFSLIRNFISQNMTWLIIGLSIFLVIVIVFWILAVISQGGLIGSVDIIERKEKANLKKGWLIGRENFWPIFGLNILIDFVLLVVFLILGIPVVLLFVNKLWLMGILVLFLNLLIFIPLAVVLAFLNIYGSRFIVLEKKGIISSLKLSFELLKDRFWPSILLGLFLYLIEIGFGLALFISLLFLISPFVLIGIISFTLKGWLALVIVGMIGVLEIIAFSVLIGSIFAAFKSAYWTLAFRRLTIK